MPFYELVCISQANLATGVMSGLLKRSAETVLDRGGVVRGFVNMGKDVPLPYRMKRHMQYHTHGFIWFMRYYCNPKTSDILMGQLKLDQRVVRCNVVKLADKLGGMVALKEKT